MYNYVPNKIFIYLFIYFPLYSVVSFHYQGCFAPEEILSKDRFVFCIIFWILLLLLPPFFSFPPEMPLLPPHCFVAHPLSAPLHLPIFLNPFSFYIPPPPSNIDQVGIKF